MDLRGHLSQHRINDSPYVCKVRSCEFRASQRMNLFDHYSQMHRDTTLLWCPFCPYVEYISRSQLRTSKDAIHCRSLIDHFMKHVQVGQTYRCRLCAYAFLTRTELHAHQHADHTGVIPPSWNVKATKNAWQTSTSSKLQIHPEQKEEGLVFSFSNEDIKHLPRETFLISKNEILVVDTNNTQFTQAEAPDVTGNAIAVPAIKKSVKLIDAKREGQAKLQMQQNKGHLQQSGKPSPSFSLIVDISKHPMHMATDLSQKIEAIWMGQGGQRGGRFDILQAIRSPVVQAALKHLEVVPTHRPDARSFTIGSFAGSANETSELAAGADFVNQLVTRGAARGLTLDDKPVKLHIGPEELEQNMIAAKERGSQFVMVISEKYYTAHKELKYLELKYNIPTQEVLMNVARSAVQRQQGVTFDNILLKTNIKNKGLNHDVKFREDAMQKLVNNKERIIIGIEMSHTTSGEKENSASVVGWSANCLGHPVLYTGNFMYVRARETEPCLDPVFKQVIMRMKKYRPKPTKLDFDIYIGGVSEGQMARVARNAVQKLRENLLPMKIEHNISVVVVSLDHAERFFIEVCLEGTVKQEPDTSQSGFTGEEKLNLKTATDEECYNQYLLLRSNAVLLAYFPRRWEQIKLTNAAFNYCSSVTGVPLKCLDCERPFPESKTVVEHAKLCKGIQEDDKEELIPVTPKKAPRRGGRSSYKPDLSITEFEKTPYLFVLLTPQLQNNLAKEILALEHVIACPGCGATYEEAGAGAAHLAFCLAPQSEYDRYKGRLSDLQSLPDREFRRIVRGTVTQSMKIVCHACGKVITTPYGAEYHVLRCGRNPEDRPWKCHYCGFASTQSLSKQHLDVECEERRKAMNSEGRTFVKEEAESEEEEEEEEPAPEPEPEPQPEEIYVGEARPKRVPKRRRADADGDHNDPDFHPTATAEIAIGGNKEINKFLTAIGSRKKMNAAGKLVKHREMPSISGGLIPGKSSRVSVGRGGTLRFKFRKLDVTETVPNQADLGRYQRAIWECQRAWEEEVMNSPFTNPLLEIPTVSWEEVPDSEYIASLRVKESIGIRHGKIPATPRKPPPEKKDRLKGPPPLGVPPIISLDWTFSQGGDLIAAVNAAGAIVFWELSKKEYVTDEGLLGAEMIADTWSSPAVDACWNSDRTLAVSFRERTIRLLDTKVEIACWKKLR
ncbi:unnamed protein product, partial [Mesorhabditis spiculigera]